MALRLFVLYLGIETAFGRSLYELEVFRNPVTSGHCGVKGGKKKLEKGFKESASGEADDGLVGPEKQDGSRSHSDDIPREDGRILESVLGLKSELMVKSGEANARRRQWRARSASSRKASFVFRPGARMIYHADLAEQDGVLGDAWSRLLWATSRMRSARRISRRDNSRASPAMPCKGALQRETCTAGLEYAVSKSVWIGGFMGRLSLLLSSRSITRTASLQQPLLPHTTTKMSEAPKTIEEPVAASAPIEAPVSTETAPAAEAIEPVAEAPVATEPATEEAVAADPAKEEAKPSEEAHKGFVKNLVSHIFPKKTAEKVEAKVEAKEEKKEVKEEKKEEEAEAKEEKKEEKKEIKEEKKEEKKARKSRSASRKRNSIFGNFLGKKEEKTEAKEETPVTTEESAPVEATPAVPETTEATPAVEPAPVVESAVEEPKAEEIKAEEPAPVAEARPNVSKRNSIFGSLTKSFNKKSEVAPIVPAKDAEPVSDTAPVIPAVESSEPLAAEVSSPATVPTETTEVAPTNGEVKPETPVVKADKRKSSLPWLSKKEKPTSDEETVEKPKSPFAKLRATVKGKSSPKAAEKPAETSAPAAEASAPAETAAPTEPAVVSEPEPVIPKSAPEVAASA